MQIFYTTQISESQIIISGDEYNHCKNVLRLKIGEQVKVTDGKGRFYNAKIDSYLKDKAELVVLSKQEAQFDIPNSALHIIITPTKNIDRMEWFVEKAVEIGIGEISFVLTSRSERKQINIERLEKIAVSAMKQSGKAWLPKINDLQPFEKFLKSSQNNTNAKFIAHLVADQQRKLLKEAIAERKNRDISFELLIGPEGDFTPAEVELAMKNEFLPVSLGESRLRTETAGVIGCATFSIILG